jgi:hypothetical protein
MIYTCCSNGSDRYEIEASSAEAAANIYASDFTPENKTYWVNCLVYKGSEEEEVENIRITIDPEIPKCENFYGEVKDSHKWESDRISGNNGGVIIVERCCHCDCKKITNTYDYDPETGEQGFESVKYVKE